MRYMKIQGQLKEMYKPVLQFSLRGLWFVPSERGSLTGMWSVFALWLCGNNGVSLCLSTHTHTHTYTHSSSCPETALQYKALQLLCKHLKRHLNLCLAYLLKARVSVETKHRSGVTGTSRPNYIIINDTVKYIVLKISWGY